MLSVLIVALAANSEASATLPLEEPYGKLEFFTAPRALGRVSVRRMCRIARDPSSLRSRKMGVVLRCYDGVGAYDWIAIPLISHLYAVEQPEDEPLFADAKMVASCTIAIVEDIWRRCSNSNSNVIRP